MPRQAAEQPRHRNIAWSRQTRFEVICEANDDRLAEPRLEDEAMVERMNTTPAQLRLRLTSMVTVFGTLNM